VCKTEYILEKLSLSCADCHATSSRQTWTTVENGDIIPVLFLAQPNQPSCYKWCECFLAKLVKGFTLNAKKYLVL